MLSSSPVRRVGPVCHACDVFPCDVPCVSCVYACHVCGVCHICHVCHVCHVLPCLSCVIHTYVHMRHKYTVMFVVYYDEGRAEKHDQGEKAAAFRRSLDRGRNALLHEKIQVFTYVFMT